MNINEYIRKVRIERAARAEAKKLFAPPLRLLSITIALIVCALVLTIVDIIDRRQAKAPDRIGMQILIENNR